ncbi:MAG: aminopeptidase P family protein [Herpetosiphonaceae bacterium]|nr:aminopeptidase P family protein [Herpetosiphonaceae bacterium]
MHATTAIATLLPRPANAELERTRTALRAAGYDFALLSSLGNVTYASGYTVPIPVGAHTELAYGSALALIGTRDATNCLLVAAGTAAAAQAAAPHFDILTFEGFNTLQPTDFEAAYLATIAHALTQAGLDNSTGRIAIEGRTLPYAVGQLLHAQFPHLVLGEAAAPLEQARLIKTEREIRLLRHAAQLGDVAQRRLAELARQPQQTEFTMWGDIIAHVHCAAGREIPISGELVTGPRVTVVEYPNGPRERQTAAGDAALMDISGRVNGYWFDCTNTYLMGGASPTSNQLKFTRASQAACEAAMDALRPGNRASDAYAAAETAFQAHGLPVAHYAGHQIGVTVNELPRLVPYDQTPIEPGMVFSVEPGAYEGAGGSFGARSEKMVLVTAQGPEILSTFAWGI